ncbi:MAG: hypothetical protein AAFR61_26835 [Bacteroidota bacterium]
MIQALTTLLLLMGSLSWTLGQDYIPYYTHCNEGDKQIYLENYEAALKEFEQAFALVDYVHARSYKQASTAAAFLGQAEKAYAYARLALLHGEDARFLDGKQYQGFRKKMPFSGLKDSLDTFRQLHEQSIDLTYQRICDSLYYVDQRIIRKNMGVSGDYKIDKSSLPEDLYDLDEEIFAYLLELIAVRGFPSEKNIGPEGYSKVWVLFHHNLRLPENAAHLPMAKEALIRGEYRPADYAWMYDQSRSIFKKEQPLFYYGVADISELTESEKAAIDAVRKEYGIKPLASTEIKRTGKSIRQRRLW